MYFFFLDKENSIAVYDSCHEQKGKNALFGWYDFTVIPVIDGVLVNSLHHNQSDCIIQFIDEG